MQYFIDPTYLEWIWKYGGGVVFVVNIHIPSESLRKMMQF